MYDTITDATLRDKIASMLFVDKTLIEKIHNAFDNKGLIKIEKSNDTNEYYIHFLSSEDYETVELLYESRDISLNHTYRWDLEPELNIIHHDDMKHLWYHKDLIQIWTKEGIFSK